MNWRKIFLNFNRFSASFAAVCILYAEMNGSSSNQRVLFGAIEKSTISNEYNSELILPFLKILLSNEINNTIINNKFLPIYLDGTSDNLTIDFNQCNSINPIDYLYEEKYLSFVIKNVFIHNLFNILKYFPIIDCSYNGRILQDESTIKIYLMDQFFHTITTLVLQTMSITRPQKHHRSTGGIGIYTTTYLNDLKIEKYNFKKLNQIICKKNASYMTVVGFDFPYEWNKFVNVEIKILPNGEMPGIVIDTREPIIIIGTEGIYRNSPDIQGSYDYYHWDTPSNPLKYIETTNYYSVYHFKDSWGWFRCFLGVGISFHLSIAIFVAFLVMINIYLKFKFIWIPDIYPIIQRRAMLRAILLLLDFIFLNWWFPFQYAFNEANMIADLGGSTFLHEMIYADGLMIHLAIIYLLGHSLRLRIRLDFNVFIYIISYEYRFILIKFCNFFNFETNQFLLESYYDQILGDNLNGLQVWQWAENKNTSATLMIHQYAWLFMAIFISTIYVIIIKIIQIYFQHEINRTTRRFTAIYPNSPILLIGKKHWTERSRLYEPLTEFDCDGTCFERSVGQIVSHTYGFVSSTRDYKEIDDSVVVTRSGMWLLGYVELANRFVLRINDYPLYAINVICQRQLFCVHGFRLIESKRSFPKYKLHFKDIQLTDLVSITLKELG